MATGTAMKTSMVTVRAMPSIRKANSATKRCRDDEHDAPISQARHPVMTVVLPLRDDDDHGGLLRGCREVYTGSALRTIVKDGVDIRPIAGYSRSRTVDGAPR